MAFAGLGLVGLLGENSKFKIKYFAITSLAVSVIVSLFLIFSTFVCADLFPIEYSQFPLLTRARLYYVNNHMVLICF